MHDAARRPQVVVDDHALQVGELSAIVVAGHVARSYVESCPALVGLRAPRREVGALRVDLAAQLGPERRETIGFEQAKGGAVLLRHQAVVVEVLWPPLAGQIIEEPVGGGLGKALLDQAVIVMLSYRGALRLRWFLGSLLLGLVHRFVPFICAAAQPFLLLFVHYITNSVSM